MKKPPQAATDARISEILMSLNKAGVRDRDAKPYLTTALEAYAQAAALVCGAMKKKPPHVDQMARQAREWAQAWDNIAHMRRSSGQLPLPHGAHANAYNSNGSISVWTPNLNTVTLRPSIHERGLVRAIETVRNDEGELRERHGRLIGQALTRLRERIDRHLAEPAVVYPWATSVGSRYELHPSVALVSGEIVGTGINRSMLRHSDEADLLRAFDRICANVEKSEAAMKDHRDRIRKSLETIKGKIAQAGLPIECEFHPSGDQAGQICLTLKGYAASGLLTAINVTRRPAERIYDMADSVLDQALERQSQLHAIHGPAPRERLDDGWKLDPVTAARLRAEGRMEIAAKAIARGGGILREMPDIVFRIDRKVLRGKFDISGPVSWTGRTLKVKKTDLPQSVQTALRGQPLTAIVEHPWIPTDVTISSIKPVRSKQAHHFLANVRLKDVPIPADCLRTTSNL